MPRTKLGRTAVLNSVQQRKILNRLIRVGMARKDLRYQEELAHRLRMESSALSRRLSGEVAWNFPELCLLFRILDFSPEEVIQAMGRSQETSV